MSLENLAGLFGLVLQEADERELIPGIFNIGILVTSSYRSSVGNSVNKKKVNYSRYRLPGKLIMLVPSFIYYSFNRIFPDGSAFSPTPRQIFHSNKRVSIKHYMTPEQKPSSTSTSSAN
jgi:hypothetical protein